MSTGGFSVPVDHRVKLKENEKMDKYLDLAREVKKLWNMKVKVIPIVVGALGTVPKGLEKGLENHSDSCKRPSANADVKTEKE